MQNKRKKVIEYFETNICGERIYKTKSGRYYYIDADYITHNVTYRYMLSKYPATKNEK